MTATNPAHAPTDIDEDVRRRILLWMSARNVTKTAIAQTTGRSPAWAIRYLNGDYAIGLSDLNAASLSLLNDLQRDVQHAQSHVCDADAWRACCAASFTGWGNRRRKNPAL